ncbi:salicylate hydroxylase [Obba rivulosa]|uniref:Salicylate hydroxylase n=1 Tax=Obba rivulosa TaxID=1052685 RepID=A0A8E2AX98_9APHY|nr:salicylate hydroxylase [Obba rivulosa]
MANPRFRIAIIGGGIAGLTLAVALGKLATDIEIHIYESAAVFTEVGAGISMSARIWETIEALGLADDMRPYAHNFDLPINFRKADQPEPITLSTTAIRTFITFHRSDFQTALCKNLPPSVHSHFSKRLVAFMETDSGEIELRFKDGTIATCDVAVGCDGIHSAVRMAMYEALAKQLEATGRSEEAAKALFHAKPVWTGTLVYRSLVSKEALASRHPGHEALTDNILYFGKNQHGISYPVGAGENAKLNVAGMVTKPHLEGVDYNGPWVAPSTKDAALREFSHFAQEFKDILECMDNVMLWAMHTIQGLPTYVDGRVAIMGDAAHAMTPYQGAGGGQAIEDAYILATILSQPTVTRETLPIALQVFDNIRRPFTQDVQWRSHESGLIYQLNTSELVNVTAEDSSAGAINTETIERMAKMQNELADWADTTSLVPDVERARKLVEERIRSSA